MAVAEEHPLYETWREIRRRCEKPNRKDYSMYGGRGIRVCERWRSSFWAFVSDMGPKPAPWYSVDRIDSNGHYEPSNCRWASHIQQAMNRRPREGYLPWIAVEIDGKTYPSLRRACRAYGVCRKSAAYRISKGMTPAEAIAELSTPRFGC